MKLMTRSEAERRARAILYDEFVELRHYARLVLAISDALLAVQRETIEACAQDFSKAFHVRHDHKYTGAEIYQWLLDRALIGE